MTRHRLEPDDGRVIHGAGQSADAFKEYFEAVGPAKPAVFMTYCSLRGDIAAYFDRLGRQFAGFPDLMPQIGLSMTRDGSPDQHYEHEVAAGRYDDNIELFAKGLAALGRPAFVRIGYEFSGQWNGYRPDSFRAAWVRVVSAFRRRGINDVASVWCYAPDARDKDYLRYYPGDEFVDWWGIDLFGVSHFSAPDTLAFVEEARRRGFPVMVGESTPRKVGVQDGEKSWEQWFEPYFAFIRSHPNVKAFCYINWDWSKYPQWKDWGDGRVQSNPVVLERYRKELSDPRYIHAR